MINIVPAKYQLYLWGQTYRRISRGEAEALQVFSALQNLHLSLIHMTPALFYLTCNEHMMILELKHNLITYFIAGIRTVYGGRIGKVF